MTNSRKSFVKWAVLAFCTLYIGLQLLFIVKAHFQSDKRFGFWMFAETTIFSAKLYRITADGKKIKTRNGRWRFAKGGTSGAYNWNSMVKDYRLYNLESRKRAKGSMSRTLLFLDATLDYVIDRIPDDPETRQLVLEVTYAKAGNDEQHVTLESKLRDL